jgi:hypothetical protein
MYASLFGVNRAKNGNGAASRSVACRPVLFHPDYTVGPGIQPGLLTFATSRIDVSLQSARGLQVVAT